MNPMIAGSLLTFAVFFVLTLAFLLMGFRPPLAGVPGAVIGLPAGIFLMRRMNARNK